MSSPIDLEVQRLQDAINDSGFPLQLGVASIVDLGRWRVVLREHAWRDGDSEKFLDLVARVGGQEHPIRLVIECKRSRGSEWIFLRENTSGLPSNNRLAVSCRIVARRTGLPSPVDEWVNLPFVPGSAETTFCVIRKNNQRSQELLERTSAELVRGTEALAIQETQMHWRPRPQSKSQGFARVYVPIIVTTAMLFVADADWSKVDPATGDVNGATVTPTGFVRFRKALGALDASSVHEQPIEDFAEQNERGVLVVQASALQTFLAKLDFGNLDNRIKEAIFSRNS